MIDSTNIYLCGHSFGGMLLPRIIKQTPEVKGLIYIAANARPLEEILSQQTIYVIENDSLMADKKIMIDSIKQQAVKIKNLKNSAAIDSVYFFRLPSSYWVDLKSYDPVKTAQPLKTPMLFLHGGRDYQVTDEDFNMWKNSMKGSNFTFKYYPDLNHFLIKGSGKSMPEEYLKAGNVDYGVIKDMAGWMQTLKK
jgi:fermentation-respiration switch protein FrsA (DUF1100 family)